MPGGLKETSLTDPSVEPLDAADAVPGRLHDTVLNSMSEGVLVFDRDGRIVSCNPAAERILQLSGPEIRRQPAGQRSWRAIRDDGSEYPYDEQPSVVTRRTGRSLRGVVMGLAHHDRKPTWLSINSEPIVRDGEVRAVVVSFTDVTRSMAAARELRRRNRELILLNRIIAHCASAEDPDELLDAVCQQLQAKLGFEAVELVKDDLGDVTHSGTRSHNVHIPIALGNGRDLALRLVPGQDNVVGPSRLRTVRMVAEQVESALSRIYLSRQNREAQKMEALGRLAGGIAHDFNNLLTAIQGHAALGLTSVDGNEIACGHLHGIQETGRRAALLTGKLLTFVRGRVSSAEVLHVDEALGEMSDLLRRLVPEHVKLVFHLGGDAGWTRADPTEFEQIVINLVVNAADAMPEGGRIDIQTEVRDQDGAGWVVLNVLDEGIGIQPESLQRIFEPLYTTKDQDRGTGLGLATVHAIVQAGGGLIQVDSRLGIGSKFEVLLPRVDSPGSGAVEAIGRDLPAGDGRTVLLVEDDLHLRPLLLRAFKDAGYAVLAAARDGEAALRAIDDMEHLELEIDLVVADIVLPRLDGRSVVDNLRVRFPHMSAILTSGYPGDIARRVQKLPPRTAFLEKPFEPFELLQLAARLVRQPTD